MKVLLLVGYSTQRAGVTAHATFCTQLDSLQVLRVFADWFQMELQTYLDESCMKGYHRHTQTFLQYSAVPTTAGPVSYACRFDEKAQWRLS